MSKKVAVPAGTKFGSWTVLEEVEPRRYPSGKLSRMVRCQCKCGCVKDVGLDVLRSGKSTKCYDCGHVKHRACGTPEYLAWRRMHERCYNKNHKYFADYGGRGVHVCERWHRDNRDGFENFLKDMGSKPSAKHSLDKDSIKPGNLCYCPEFCCWATKKEQSRNLRSNRIIEFKGRLQCISAWAEEVGLDGKTIRGRLDSGWPVEDALTRPARSCKRKTA